MVLDRWPSGCSCRGPKFNFQYPNGSSQLFIIWCPHLTSKGVHVMHTYTRMQDTCTQKKSLKIKNTLVIKF